MPDIKARVGRRRINGEQTVARFPKGWLDMIEGCLWEGESRAEFIREAVLNECQRRNRRYANVRL